MCPAKLLYYLAALLAGSCVGCVQGGKGENAARLTGEFLQGLDDAGYVVDGSVELRSRGEPGFETYQGFRSSGLPELFVRANVRKRDAVIASEAPTLGDLVDQALRLKPAEPKVIQVPVTQPGD